jgi:hypothetical protein
LDVEWKSALADLRGRLLKVDLGVVWEFPDILVQQPQKESCLFVWKKFPRQRIYIGLLEVVNKSRTIVLVLEIRLFELVFG